MPFNQDRPQPQRGKWERDGNLMRLGGLYPSKTGKALTGNMGIGWQDQDGQSMGKKLIEMIERALDDNLPLRFVIFDNTDRAEGNRPPYSLHVTFGMSRPAMTTPVGAPPIARRPPEQPRADTVPDWVGGYNQEPTEAPEPEPVPRVNRRGPPRR